MENAWSLFFPHALEGLAVLLHIHETAGFRVPLDPLLCHRVEDLRPVTHRSVAVTIARWRNSSPSLHPSK